MPLEILHRAARCRNVPVTFTLYCTDMPRMAKLLSSGKSLYVFSHDLVWGCRHYAQIARDAKMDFEVVLANTSALLMAASVVEARLNELSAEVVAIEPPAPRAPLPFWKVLHGARKGLSWKEKWNLVASVSGGSVWDGTKEPFQSYDLIAALRNELVHYKSEYGEGLTPPVGKIGALIQRFKGPGFIFSLDSSDDHWVATLLSSRDLAEWISESVDELDMRFDHLLTGEEFTEQDKWMYEHLKASGNPFTPSAI